MVHQGSTEYFPGISHEMILRCVSLITSLISCRLDSVMAFNPLNNKILNMWSFKMSYAFSKLFFYLCKYLPIILEHCSSAFSIFKLSTDPLLPTFFCLSFLLTLEILSGRKRNLTKDQNNSEACLCLDFSSLMLLVLFQIVGDWFFG